MHRPRRLRGPSHRTRRGDLSGGRLLVASLVVVCGLVGCANERVPFEVQTEDPSGEIGGKGDSAYADWLESELTAWNAGLTPEDRSAKYERMAESAYAFFRGTNHLFWARFYSDPWLGNYGSETTVTWLQGDLHAYNYGAFQDDDGDVVYDLNDFDESVVGDYQLDVWRMATSLVLIGWENELDDRVVDDSVDAFAEAYLDALADYRGNDDELDITFTSERTYGRLDDFLEDVAGSESRGELLDDWTVELDGDRFFDTSLDQLEWVDDELWYAVVAAMEEYGTTLSGGLDWDASYFAVKDVARRLDAGTGSLGTPRYYVLIDGPSDALDDDIILDVKRQAAPTAYAYMNEATRASRDAHYSNHAERTVLAQRALLDDVDDHLGWLHLGDGYYSVRERSPFKASFPTEELDTAVRFEKLAEQWGTILATDHARADRDFDEDIVPWSFDREVDELTDGDHDGFRALVREVAREYAEQVLLDYGTFLELLDVGI